MMKLGFYDSGLGGLSVLREFINAYNGIYSYYYFGDSARAPYGNKSKEELKQYIKEILDYMQERDIDVVIAACNTSSMIMHEMDLGIYDFEVINLYDVMNDYFCKNNQNHEEIALLATQSTIDSKRYLNWKVKIYPQACSDLVPLIECGKLNEAKDFFVKHLSSLPSHIKEVIIGCTHFAFLSEELDCKFNFIDPAKISLKYFQQSPMSDLFLSKAHKKNQNLDLNLYFSKADDGYLNLARNLLHKNNLDHSLD